MSKSRGFTLVELLITISIIAILSAIALMTYTYVMKQGRDSKRMSDLRAIQSALEQYYSDQGFYPYFSVGIGGVTWPGLDDIMGSGSFTNLIGNFCDPFSVPPCPSSKSYINSLPHDPTGSTRYTYKTIPTNCDNSSSNKCTSYCLYAKLENTSPGLGSCPANGTYNFAVSPP